MEVNSKTGMRSKGYIKLFQKPYEGFHLIFRKVLEGLFIDRMKQNEGIFAKFMNDPEFETVVEDGLGRQVYDQIRSE